MGNLRKAFILICIIVVVFLALFAPTRRMYQRQTPVWPVQDLQELTSEYQPPEKNSKTSSKSTEFTTYRLDSIADKRKRGNLTTKIDQINQMSGTGKIDSIKLGKSSSEHFFNANHWARLVNKVDCKALIRGERAEQRRTFSIVNRESVTSKQGSYYINITKDCKHFKSSSGYITSPVNMIEENFPLAFSILMYKNIEQVERLLRAIYRPQNFYCIHVDSKAKPDIKSGMKSIAKCFDNVYLVPNPSDVRWGTLTVLEPELKCMRLLWSKKKWKYYINLTGQEFPLKTNLELVRILQTFNGANNVENNRRENWEKRWKMAGPAPHGITPIKGSVHVVVSRGYVDYLLHNKVAKDLLEWVRRVHIPDEVYFNTLNHNPQLGVPGSYTGDVENYDFLTRYKLWYRRSKEGCHGKFVRGVCIFGIGDLPNLTTTHNLFANKFHWDYQHYTRDCLEEWHFNKTREELIHPSTLNLTFYQELSFVKEAMRPRNAYKVS